MPVFCVVYGCSNQSNGENTRRFYHVQKCVVHKGGKVKKLTEKCRKKWLVLKLSELQIILFTSCLRVAFGIE